MVEATALRATSPSISLVTSSDWFELSSALDVLLSAAEMASMHLQRLHVRPEADSQALDIIMQSVAVLLKNGLTEHQGRSGQLESWTADEALEVIVGDVDHG